MKSKIVLLIAHLVIIQALIGAEKHENDFDRLVQKHKKEREAAVQEFIDLNALGVLRAISRIVPTMLEELHDKDAKALFDLEDLEEFIKLSERYNRDEERRADELGHAFTSLVRNKQKDDCEK